MSCSAVLRNCRALATIQLLPACSQRATSRGRGGPHRSLTAPAAPYPVAQRGDCSPAPPAPPRSRLRGSANCGPQSRAPVSTVMVATRQPRRDLLSLSLCPTPGSPRSADRPSPDVVHGCGAGTPYSDRSPPVLLGRPHPLSPRRILRRPEQRRLPLRSATLSVFSSSSPPALYRTTATRPYG